MAGKDRKRELARQRYERQMQRRAVRQARARRVKIIGTVVAVAVVAGGSGAIAFAMNRPAKKTSAAAATTTPTPTPTPTPTVSVKPGECGYIPLTGAAAAGAKNVGTPPVKPVKGAYKMTIDTTLGTIAAKVDGTKAACTVNSFKYLAGKKFFNNTKCHRLVTQGIKVLQCGDPTATGAGGPSYGFGNENVPKGGPTKQVTYKRGVIAMAHTDAPNSNGSQFFIVYGDSPLPANYTIFGQITEGMDVVDSVAKAGAEAPDPQTGNTAPKKKIEIKDLTVAKM